MSAPAEPYPWLRPLTEWGPLIAFFAAYWAYGLIPATGVLVATTLAATLLAVVLARRVPWMPVVTAAAVGAFGGLTLVFDDDLFIKIKPTVVQALMAAALLGGLAFGRLFLKALMERGIAMTDKGWRALTWRFAGFLLFGAALNEAVWRTQSDDVWVTFKAFGLTGLAVAFMLAQLPLIRRHAPPEGAEPAEEDGGLPPLPPR